MSKIWEKVNEEIPTEVLQIFHDCEVTKRGFWERARAENGYVKHFDINDGSCIGLWRDMVLTLNEFIKNCEEQ